MNTRKHIWTYLMACSLVVVLRPLPGIAHRRVQRRTRRILLLGHIQWQNNLDSICMVGHHSEFRPL